VKEAGEMGEFLSSSPPGCTPMTSYEAPKSDVEPQLTSATEPEKSSCHLPAEDLKTKELFI